MEKIMDSIFFLKWLQAGLRKYGTDVRIIKKFQQNILKLKKKNINS
jgi:hypothetical protein